MIFRVFYLFLLLPFFTFSFFAQANQGKTEKVVIDDAELPRDTLLPKVLSPRVVYSQKVPIKGKADLTVASVFLVNTPFRNPLGYGIQANFYINNFHGIAVGYDGYENWAGSLFTFLEPEINIRNSEDQEALDNFKDKSVKQNIYLQYNHLPLYGKISLGKNTYFNTRLYAGAGMGATMISNKWTPAAFLSLGQKGYFNSRFGFGLEIRAIVQQQPKIEVGDLGELFVSTVININFSGLLF